MVQVSPALSLPRKILQNLMIVGNRMIEETRVESMVGVSMVGQMILIKIMVDIPQGVLIVTIDMMTTNVKSLWMKMRENIRGHLPVLIEIRGPEIILIIQVEIVSRTDQEMIGIVLTSTPAGKLIFLATEAGIDMEDLHLLRIRTLKIGDHHLTELVLVIGRLI